MIAHVRTVAALLEQAGRLEAVHKADLRCGDRVVVATENSVYSICVLEDSSYAVTGGWFDRNGLSPARTAIVGCTWGGSAVKRDIVAALGLRLEFGNRVITTRIREVRVIRGQISISRPWRLLREGELFQACYAEGSDRS